MKLAIILGTRPEIIRLYHTVKLFKTADIYWTGQNFSKNLSSDIFEDFSDAYSNITHLSTGEEIEFSKQFSKMLVSLTDQLKAKRPDKVLILGDTNSSLAGALAAKKLRIQLFHMEAGNRCYDPMSPEEVNRKLIDSISDIHLCYTKHAKENLIREGVPINKIHVIGNPIAEFSNFYTGPYSNNHILVTCHRAENEKYLHKIVQALKELQKTNKVLCCLHPRFIEYFLNEKLDVIPSISFYKFLELEKQSSVIITDSGTVCEEASILKKPCVIIRNSMERPELFEVGGTILSDFDNIVEAVTEQLKSDSFWESPYPRIETSKIVKNILVGKGNYVN